MEPDDVLAHDLVLRGPEARQRVLGLQRVDSRQVVGKGVEPDVHDVLGGEPLGDPHAPAERGARDGQVLQSVLAQAGEDVVAELLGLHELRVRLDVRDEPLLVVAHAEEVALLLHPLEGQSGADVHEARGLSLHVRDEALLALIVPALVRVQVYVTLCGALDPQLL